MTNRYLTKDEMTVLGDEHRRLGARLGEIDARLAKLKHLIDSLAGQLRRPDATDRHSERMWKWVNERKALIEEKRKLEGECNAINGQLLAHSQLYQSTYAGKMFMRAFVAAAEDLLPPQVFKAITNTAMRRRRAEIGGSEAAE